jgi:hypothetical protein
VTGAGPHALAASAAADPSRKRRREVDRSMHRLDHAARGRSMAAASPRDRRKIRSCLPARDAFTVRA